MTKKDLKIVFMGTPDFAVESLRALVEGGYHIAGVVTMPDKSVGRHGSTLQPSAVKQYALSQNLPVLQPFKLKDEGFIEELRALQADLQIVVAFRMLPEVVWDMPRFGTFNLHASLLPQYRGAAPINWAVINGEAETGVTTFFLTHEIDTGRIIRQEKLPIAETDDAGIVHDALMKIGAGLVTETVDLLIENEGNIETKPQDTLLIRNADLRPAPKIFIETCRINWEQSAANVYNFIRGLSPYPGAWTEIINPAGVAVSLKIFAAEKIVSNVPNQNFLKSRFPEGSNDYKQAVETASIGAIRTDGKHYLDVSVADGFIRIISLQIAGKKRMSVRDFLNGTKIDNSWKLKS
jgi:methionyl-tRNA formyltransferase